MNYNIKICNKEDIKKVMYIGEITFRETFSDENTKEDMNNYCTKNFNFDVVKNEIENENSKIFIVENKNEVIAYMKINFPKAQTEKNFENSLEIQRIYVKRECKGQGIGKTLLEKAINFAKENKVDYVWLGVWEKNFKAVSFYEKLGFVKFDEHKFILGDDIQIDNLMKLKLQ